MQPIFVGDVQGCAAEFDELLARAKARYGRDFELWLVGDLVNRGPDSLELLRRVRDWVERGRCRYVLGNHEISLLRAAWGLRQPHPLDTFDDILDDPTFPDWVEWLRRLPLAVSGELGGRPFTMVHAAVGEKWSLDDVNERARAVEACLGAEDAERAVGLLAANRDADPRADDLALFTRCRSLTRDGQWSSRDPSRPEEAWHRRWAKRGHEYAVVYGHCAATSTPSSTDTSRSKGSTSRPGCGASTRAASTRGASPHGCPTQHAPTPSRYPTPGSGRRRRSGATTTREARSGHEPETAARIRRLGRGGVDRPCGGARRRGGLRGVRDRGRRLADADPRDGAHLGCPVPGGLSGIAPAANAPERSDGLALAKPARARRLGGPVPHGPRRRDPRLDAGDGTRGDDRNAGRRRHRLRLPRRHGGDLVRFDGCSAGPPQLAPAPPRGALLPVVRVRLHVRQHGDRRRCGLDRLRRGLCAGTARAARRAPRPEPVAPRTHFTDPDRARRSSSARDQGAKSQPWPATARFRNAEIGSKASVWRPRGL
ncbi:MAG: metallophosphoesterase [Deltaproteobacteria bacterium]|nr:metallophosphoesterase [Deltaproteobacteria bacterium]